MRTTVFSGPFHFKRLLHDRKFWKVLASRDRWKEMADEAGAKPDVSKTFFSQAAAAEMRKIGRKSDEKQTKRRRKADKKKMKIGRK